MLVRDIFDKFNNISSYIECFKRITKSEFKAYFPDEIDKYLKIPVCLQAFRSESIFVERFKYEILLRKISKVIIEEFSTKEKCNIIDIGAHIGDNALVWAILSQAKDGKVLAIDPSDRNLNWIKKIAQENLIRNILTKKALASSSEGNDLFIKIGWLHHASFSNVPSSKDSVPFYSTTLDKIKNESLEKSTLLLHIDVEGMELEVMSGALNILKNESPFIIFENHLIEKKAQLNKIEELLTYFEYSIFMINEIIPKCKLDCRNFLAIPKKEKVDIKELNKKISLIRNTEKYGFYAYPAMPTENSIIEYK